MRRLFVLVALAIAGAATMLAAVGSARSPRPPGLIVFYSLVGHGESENLEVFAIRPDGSGRVRLTYGVHWAGYPDLAPDRRHIVFEVDSGSWPVEVMTIGGTSRDVVVEPGEEPRWSPDGRWIAWRASLVYGSTGLPTDGPADIYIVHPDGSDLRKVVDGGAYNMSDEDQAFDWSPDGSRIAFETSAPSQPYHPTVNVVDLASGVITRTGAGKNPDWSRRGDLIAFAQGRSILVAHPGGSGLRRVTTLPKHALTYEPSWSHSGRRLAFYATDDGYDTGWLYLVDADGSHRVRVHVPAHGFVGAGQPRWSPDDRWVVWGDGARIYRVRSDGTSLVRLTWGSSPDWE